MQAVFKSPLMLLLSAAHSAIQTFVFFCPYTVVVLMIL